MRLPKLGVRTRILAIALVPSVALVVIGVGAAGTLVNHSHHARTWADELETAIGPTRELVQAVQVERQLTLWRIAGADSDVQQLVAARQRLDQALEHLAPAQSRLQQMGPKAMGDSTDAFAALAEQLVGIRSAVDAGTLAFGDAYAFYNRMPDLVLAGVHIAEHSAPDAATTTELAESAEVLQCLEAVSRAYALGAALTDGNGLPPELDSDYLQATGYYRTRIQAILVDQDTEGAAVVKKLLASPDWQQLGAMEAALSQHALPRTLGTTPVQFQSLPLSTADWQRVAAAVDQALADLWQSENVQVQHLASDAAADTTRKSVLAGAGIVAVALIAILVALVLANRIIRRLKRLRDRTFALADTELPETMRRLATGTAADVQADTPPLDFGHDEIGQVAAAFGHAHGSAVAAAVTEARTREGVKAVFVNIAHRSQVVVHRQLEILDEAESKQEDPALLEIFFLLDHLATRERRNAENLVILAGGRPGRQWRNPVPLMDLVRGAVGETLEYTRVRTARLPQAFIAGVAVGDLIHLLAELIDNAASFSPPQSRVEISGSTVGRGVAVEISDQGMGIPDAELHRLNELLGAPTDFGLTSLSADSRLGLFVVSQLAARHGISVRLTDSDYGGIRAIVLVPATVIAGEISAGDPVAPRSLRPRRAEYLHPPEALLAPDTTSTALPRPLRPDTRADAEPTPAPIQRTAHRPVVADMSARRTDPPANGRAVPSQPAGRPPLPRRRRQASLAPELAQDLLVDPVPADDHDPAVARSSAPQPLERSPEQARDLFSAIENGTRQGRRAEPGALDRPISNRQEDDGEHLPRW
ncbi:nitrate- and nitrite sensing domain-containing protein [Nocardia sp. NPDC020380]|uniref:sensor histidine kinase n=1 Tax=Nocardia sp. NPDC020380 TaxID=3364309 RepID=UPI00378D42D5